MQNYLNTHIVKQYQHTLIINPRKMADAKYQNLTTCDSKQKPKNYSKCIHQVHQADSNLLFVSPGLNIRKKKQKSCMLGKQACTDNDQSKDVKLIINRLQDKKNVIKDGKFDYKEQQREITACSHCENRQKRENIKNIKFITINQNDKIIEDYQISQYKRNPIHSLTSYSNCNNGYNHIYIKSLAHHKRYLTSHTTRANPETNSSTPKSRITQIRQLRISTTKRNKSLIQSPMHLQQQNNLVTNRAKQQVKGPVDQLEELTNRKNNNRFFILRKQSSTKNKLWKLKKTLNEGQNQFKPWDMNQSDPEF